MEKQDRQKPKSPRCPECGEQPKFIMSTMEPSKGRVFHTIPAKSSRDLNPVKVEVPKWRLSRALNQDLQQFIGVRFDGLTNLDKFHDVDTPFAAFVFGDEGLRSTKALGELVLCQAGSFARPDHQLAERGLRRGMDGLVKFARTSSHRRGRLIRSSDYPKKGYILTLLPHSPASRWTCRAKEANWRQGQFGGLL
jgi:hypothetical protein